MVLLKEYISGLVDKSMDAFAGSGSLFRIDPSWLSCRLPVIFRLRLVLLLYEQSMIGKRDCCTGNSPFWRYKINMAKAV